MLRAQASPAVIAISSIEPFSDVAGGDPGAPSKSDRFSKECRNVINSKPD